MIDTAMSIQQSQRSLYGSKSLCQPMIELFLAHEFCAKVAHQGSTEQRHHEAATGRRLRYDDDGHQRRPHDAGETGDHAQQHDRARRISEEDTAKHVANACSHRQGRREYATGQTQCRGERRQKLGRAKPERNVVPGDDIMGGLAAGVPGQPRRDAKDRHRHAAYPGEQNRPRPQSRDRLERRPPCRQHQPREAPTGHATDKPGNGGHEQSVVYAERLAHFAEIDIIAGKTEADHARDQDGRHHQRPYSIRRTRNEISTSRVIA